MSLALSSDTKGLERCLYQNHEKVHSTGPSAVPDCPRWVMHQSALQAPSLCSWISLWKKQVCKGRKREEDEDLCIESGLVPV